MICLFVGCVGWFVFPLVLHCSLENRAVKKKKARVTHLSVLSQGTCASYEHCPEKEPFLLEDDF